MTGTIVSELQSYLENSPRSDELSARARTVIPGETTRTSTYLEPYPLYLVSGLGCRVVDLDGRSRIDLLGNYSSLILGHSHPAVVEAVAAQNAIGACFAAPTQPEVDLAIELVGRIDSVEQVRFASSGTEATMFAMRLARAHTGRSLIARFEGGYHGSHDYASVSGSVIDETRWGPADRPNPVPDTRGLAPAVLEATIVLPFNNLEACQAILAEHADDLAAIIVEPMLGKSGMIPPVPAFLSGLREIADSVGAVLIFDEIMTLRLAPGGAQSLFGVRPDLTTMGNIIGGGLPVAAFGGRSDIMQLMNPNVEGFLPQGGTFNGAAIGMAAGLAQLRELQPQTYASLNATGEALKQGFLDSFHAHGVPAFVTGIGSLFNVHFSSTAPRDYRDAIHGESTVLREFVIGMINEGVLLAPRGMAAVSTPIGSEESAEILTAVDRLVERNAPSWIARLS